MAADRTRVATLCWALLWAAFFGAASARSEPLPRGLTAAILVKVLEFEETCCKEENLSIHVVGDEPLAESLGNMVGRAILEGRLARVSQGSELPESGVDVLVVNDEADAEAYIAYSRKVGALSVTSERNIVERGASLAIFNDEGMPGILLNNESSIREGKKWRPEILEVAELYKE